MEKKDLIPLLPDMAAFVHVVDAGGFSAAARKLGVTPSAVSRQVQRLERALSVRLIDRTTRSLHVTEIGLEISERCREMTDAAASAMEIAHYFHAAPRGMIRLAAPSSYARHLLHPLIPRFLAEYREVDVNLVMTGSDIDPIATGADLIVQVTDTPFEGWSARALHDVAYILCASPCYLKANGTPQHPLELARHVCLHANASREDHRWRFQRDGESLSIPVRGRYLSNHSGVRCEAAMFGLGIACIPDYVARAELDQGRLVRILEDWTLKPLANAGKVWLMYTRNRYLPPKTRVLIDFLVRQLAQAVDTGAATARVGEAHPPL